MDSPHKRPPDLELLERYALGRLTQGEREEVDRLVTRDAAWREALDRELRIASGVRRLGRDRLKARLRENLKEPPPAGVPWPRIIAVAASVVIIVGVMVISQWNWLRNGVETAYDQSVSDIATTPEEEPSPLAADEGSSIAGRKQEARIEEAQGSIVSEAKRSDKKQMATAAGSPLPAASDQEAAASGSSEGDRLWTQAQVYRSLQKGESGPEKLLAAGESRRAENALAEEDRSLGRADERMKAGIALMVSVEQGLFDSLAATTQSRFANSPRGQFPAMVEQQEETLRVILYPETPFDAAELERARVELPAEDSLLITIAGQQIGLHLPAGSRLQPLPKTRR